METKTVRIDLNDKLTVESSEEVLSQLLLRWMLWLEGEVDLSTKDAISKFLNRYKDERFNPSKRSMSINEN